MHKKFRLTKRDDFKIVYRNGKSVANREFVLYYSANRTTENFRLGVSVSKKVGNAVVRNLVKRRVKEAVRQNSSMIQCCYDLIVIARNPSVNLPQSNTERSLIHLLRKSGLLKKGKNVFTGK